MHALCLIPFLLFSLASAKPNIIFLVIDDVGWTDVSYHGAEFPTPNIDNIAKTGVELDSVYVQPVCSPTRSSLMTGRYPFHTGLQHYTTLMPGSLAGIPANATTLPEALNAVNYESTMIGKWHLGSGKMSQTPNGRGFSSFVGYLQGQVDYYNKTVAGAFDFWNNTDTYHRAVGTYSMTQYLGAFNNFVDQYKSGTKEKPFFLYFAHQVAHIPLEFPDNQEAYKKRCDAVTDSKRFVYCTMMLRLDDAIGEMIQTLKDNDMWDNTVLFLITDNGGMPNFQAAWPASAGVNFPFRAGKATLFEGGIKALAAVNGGKHAFAPEDSPIRGSVNKGLWYATDLHRTALHLGGARIAKGVAEDSFDMWPFIVNKTSTVESPRKEIAHNINFGGKAYTCLRSGDYKLIIGNTGPYDGYYQIPPSPFIPPPDESGHFKLFNIAQDPYEKTDLSTKHPEIVEQMRKRLQEIMEEGYEPPQPNVAVCQPVNSTWVPCRP